MNLNWTASNNFYLHLRIQKYNSASSNQSHATVVSLVLGWNLINLIMCWKRGMVHSGQYMVYQPFNHSAS